MAKGCGGKCCGGKCCGEKCCGENSCGRNFKSTYFKHFTRQHICLIFGTVGVYFEVLFEMPFFILVHYWLFDDSAKDGWTNWDFFYGPNFGLYLNIPIDAEDKFKILTEEQIFLTLKKGAAANNCGIAYKPYLNNHSVTFYDAGLQYWDDLLRSPEETFYAGIRVVMNLYTAAAALYLLTNAFLVLACSMGHHGDRKLLKVAFFIDLIPLGINGVAAVLFQQGRFCLMDIIVAIIPFRGIFFVLYLIRVAVTILKSYVLCMYIKHLSDVENLHLMHRNHRNNSATYRQLGPEAELGFSHDIFDDPHDDLHLGGETASEERERLRQHKLLMDAVNASLNASSSTIDLSKLESTLLAADPNALKSSNISPSLSQMNLSTLAQSGASPTASTLASSMSLMGSPSTRKNFGNKDDDSMAPKNRKTRKVAPGTHEREHDHFSIQNRPVSIAKLRKTNSPNDQGHLEYKPDTFESVMDLRKAHR